MRQHSIRQLLVPNLENGGSEKKVPGELEFLPHIFAWGAYYVSRRKRLGNIKYGFEGSISNVDLGQFLPNNQLTTN